MTNLERLVALRDLVLTPETGQAEIFEILGPSARDAGWKIFLDTSKTPYASGFVELFERRLAGVGCFLRVPALTTRDQVRAIFGSETPLDVAVDDWGGSSPYRHSGVQEAELREDWRGYTITYLSRPMLETGPDHPVAVEGVIVRRRMGASRRAPPTATGG